MTFALRKPNLFVIGAMKSGTTSLHEYLDTHPQIAMSAQKEPAYFAEEFTLKRGENWYLSLFSQDPQYRYLGESSAAYTRLPLFQGIPERLHQFNPEARLIYIMRNPFDRVISHYWHAVRIRPILKGHVEARALRQAIHNSPEVYLATSNYALQLAPYVRLFGLGSLYTLTFESLVANPQRELDGIYNWLDLPSHSLAGQIGRVHNPTPRDTTSAAGAGILYRIRFSNTWDRIAPYVPNKFKQWAKHRAYRAPNPEQWQQEIAQLRAEISGLQSKQLDALSRLLGKEFPEWQAESSKHDQPLDGTLNNSD